MLFNFFIPTICETSHSNNLSFKCEYISHGIHPLKRKPFLINEYPMIALSAQSWLFDPLNHCYQHALVFCIVVLSTVQRSQDTFPDSPCMDSPARKTFDTMDSHVHESATAILLVWASHQVELGSKTNCCAYEGDKHWEDLQQWALPWAHHICKLDTTL